MNRTPRVLEGCVWHHRECRCAECDAAGARLLKSYLEHPKPHGLKLAAFQVRRGRNKVGAPRLHCAFFAPNGDAVVLVTRYVARALGVPWKTLANGPDVIVVSGDLKDFTRALSEKLFGDKGYLIVCWY